MLVVVTGLAGFPQIRKWSDKDDIHQGQGKNKEFYFKFLKCGILKKGLEKVK